MIRVAIVDDHPVVREGIAANLSASGRIEVSGAVGSLAEALALTVAPDVVVLDAELAGDDGIAAIPALKAAHAGARVVVFTAHAGEERIALAFARGADSYVLKGTPSAELIETIVAVADGRTRLSREVESQLALSAVRQARGEHLTRREREILALVADGLANRDIAARLNIAERTVKFHLTAILARLGAKNRSQALAVARSRGLL